MRLRTLLLLAVIAGSTARAQSPSDTAYCTELSHLYTRYLGSPEDTERKFQASRDPEARWAMERCRYGDPLAGIPILERKLANGKVTLPPRP